MRVRVKVAAAQNPLHSNKINLKRVASNHPFSREYQPYFAFDFMISLSSTNIHTNVHMYVLT